MVSSIFSVHYLGQLSISYRLTFNDVGTKIRSTKRYKTRDEDRGIEMRNEDN